MAAPAVREASWRIEITPPGIEFVRADVRFPEVIKHKARVRERSGEINRRR